jgi:signal transduction histidine kinase
MSEPQSSSHGATPHVVSRGLLHELRTQLNQVLGYSEMLIERAEEQSQPAFVPDLQKTHAAGQQLLTLIDRHFQPASSAETPASSAPPPEANLAAPAPDQTNRGWPRDLVEGASTDHGRLLVVDDEEANRDVLSRRLERQGFAVASAKNGRAALAMLQETPFDLVLLDIMMPEMDGYEVLERLKADARLRHLPVVIISALSELDSVVRCIELGADDYLPKPFNPTLLKARIGACLEKKRARDREAELFAQLQENFSRLQELEAWQDDLTHMIVHDLRTPLNGLLLGLQALELGGDLNDEQREILNIAAAGGATLAGMINDLLDVSKMESGSMNLVLEELTVPELVEAALLQVANIATARKLTLMSDLAPGLPPFLADRSKLVRTLVNILGNALKFSSSGGVVRVAAGRGEEPPALIFSVTDCGEGIPPEEFAHIFEKFGQVESRESGRLASTGLGLTFCKLVVEAHRGRIWVESTPGQGSTFRFAIPLI